MALGTFVLLFEVWLVSRLGVEPLAGFTLCLPLAFLMTTMSAGGFGGGVTSAVARAQSSTVHYQALIRVSISLSLMIGVGCALLLAVKPGWLLERMTESESALFYGKQFAAIFFAGAPLLWLSNTLASIHRGLGRPGTPAKIGALTALLQVSVSYPIILGFGSFEGLGIRGAAMVPIAGYALQVILQLGVLYRELGSLSAVLPTLRLGWKYTADILAVGLPSSINTLTVALVSLQLTGLAAGLGTTELAGFGVSARIESIVLPLIFAIGTSLVALIGIEWGRSNYLQARRYLTVGAVLSFILTTSVGLIMALMPLSILEHLSDSSEVAVAAKAYLQIAGPFLGLLGLGLSFSFAGQGIKRPLTSLFASLSRLGMTTFGAYYLAIHSLAGLGWLTVASLALYAVVLIGGIAPLFRLKHPFKPTSGNSETAQLKPSN